MLNDREALDRLKIDPAVTAEFQRWALTIVNRGQVEEDRARASVHNDSMMQQLKRLEA